MGKTALFKHATAANFRSDASAFEAFKEYRCIVVAFSARDFADCEVFLKFMPNLSRQSAILTYMPELTAICQQLAAIGMTRLPTTIFTGNAEPMERDFLKVNGGINEESKFMGFEKNGRDLSVSSIFRSFDSATNREMTNANVFTLDYLISSDTLEALTDCIGSDGKVDRTTLSKNLDAYVPRRVPAMPITEDFLKACEIDSTRFASEWEQSSGERSSTLTQIGRAHV